MVKEFHQRTRGKTFKCQGGDLDFEWKTNSLQQRPSANCFQAQLVQRGKDSQSTPFLTRLNEISCVASPVGLFSEDFND